MHEHARRDADDADACQHLRGVEGADLQDRADEREAGADEDAVAAAVRAAQVGRGNDAGKAAAPRDAGELPAVDLWLFF